MKEARYYEKTGNGRVHCFLCPFNCAISDGKAGNCRVRVNKGGVLYSLIHNRISGLSFDPIEKKPLFHFFPGSKILSVGAMGCNFRCRFCQNADISQTADIELEETDPEDLLRTAVARKSLGIAYTYNEPSIWIESILGIAPLFSKAGLKNVLVTNGYINRKPLDDILPHIDAMNIDIKAFRDDFYSKICGAKLKPVLENVEYLHKKIHLELTMLVVPTLNDDREEIAGFIDWVASMDKSIPVHFSRYFPRYKMDIPATPEKTLRSVYELAKKKLDYVYVGNIRIPNAENTACPSCGNPLIVRSGYASSAEGLKSGKCSECGYSVKGVFA